MTDILEIDFPAFDPMRNATEMMFFLLATSIYGERSRMEFAAKIRGAAHNIESDPTMPPCDLAMMRRVADAIDGTCPPAWVPKVIEGGKTD